MTPEEELLDAARIVLEYAGKAPVGPWWIHQSEEYGPVLCNADSPEDREAGGACIAFFAYPGDVLVRAYAGADDTASWMALANPLIAEPLADWLTREARQASAGDGYAGMRLRGGNGDPALALARVIRQQHEAMQGGED